MARITYPLGTSCAAVGDRYAMFASAGHWRAELQRRDDRVDHALEMALLSRDGREYRIDFRAAPIREPAGRVLGVVVVFRDATEDKSVRNASRLALEWRGYRVATAIDGEAALALFLQCQSEVRLVVTDVMTPVMGGVTLIQRLRSTDPAIAIIATTGLGDSQTRERLVACGMNHVLLKPFDASEFLRVVQAHLPKAAGRSAGAPPWASSDA